MNKVGLVIPLIFLTIAGDVWFECESVGYGSVAPSFKDTWRVWKTKRKLEKIKAPFRKVYNHIRTALPNSWHGTTKLHANSGYALPVDAAHLFFMCEQVTARCPLSECLKAGREKMIISIAEAGKEFISSKCLEEGHLKTLIAVLLTLEIFYNSNRLRS